MSVPKNTPEQQSAIDHRGEVCVLSSGAGCGKTSVLSDRYLSLLEHDRLTPAKILAISFTDRAAREMRKRIRAKVDKKIVQLKTETSNDIAEENEQQPEEIIRWEKIRQELDFAPIQTFNSFGNAVIQRHCDELGLQQGFQVLTEGDATVLRNEVTRSALEKILLEHQTENSKLLQELVVVFGWKKVNQIVSELLKNADVDAWQTYLNIPVSQLCEEWIVYRKKTYQEYFGYLKIANQGVINFLSLADDLKALKQKQKQKLDLLTQQFHDLEQVDQFTDLKSKLAEVNQNSQIRHFGWSNDFTHTADYELMKSALKDFREAIRKELKGFVEPEGESLSAAFETANKCLKIALNVQVEFAKAKISKNAVDYGDQLSMTKKLFQNPAIRAEYSQRFAAIMVDEFQDTDPTQLAVVLSLARQIKSNQAKTKTNTKTKTSDEFQTLVANAENLFVVGDEKQSIYAFRGAVVSLFRQLRKSVSVAGNKSLTINFRSRPGIIRFVNFLCSKRLENYEALTAHRPESSLPQDVEFLWTQPAEDDLPEDRVDAIQRETRSIAAKINDLLLNEMIQTENDEQPRPVCKKDIVILFRAMSHVMQYETALQQAGIDYYLVGGKAFYGQQEVYDLFNLLKSVENPFDEPALVGLLRSPFCGMSDNGLTLLTGYGRTIYDQLYDEQVFNQLPVDDREVLGRFRPRFKGWREQKDRLPVSQLLKKAIEETGFDAALQFEPLADRKLANLWKLLNIAREYDRNNFSAVGLIELLEEHIRSQPSEEQAATRPEEDDVVRLMTIHQAKGLEFPIVFLPDFAASERNSDFLPVVWAAGNGGATPGCFVRRPTDLEADDEFSFSEMPYDLHSIRNKMSEWQERLRLLYVACTRASERLILSTAWMKPLNLNAHVSHAGEERQKTEEAQQSTGRFKKTQVPSKNRSTWPLVLAERFDLLLGDCIHDHSVQNHSKDFDSAKKMVKVNLVYDAEQQKDHGDQRLDSKAVWQPRLPGLWSKALPAKVSLPAIERGQMGWGDPKSLSPHLRLIPEPSLLEVDFFQLWQWRDWQCRQINSVQQTAGSYWQKFTQSELGQRIAKKLECVEFDVDWCLDEKEELAVDEQMTMQKNVSTRFSTSIIGCIPAIIQETRWTLISFVFPRMNHVRESLLFAAEAIRKTDETIRHFFELYYVETGETVQFEFDPFDTVPNIRSLLGKN